MHGTVVNEYTNVVHCCVLDWLKYFIPVFVFRCCWRDVYWHWASSGQVICNPPVTAPSGEATLKFMNTFSQQGPVWLKVIVRHKEIPVCTVKQSWITVFSLIILQSESVFVRNVVDIVNTPLWFLTFSQEWRLPSFPLPATSTCSTGTWTAACHSSRRAWSSAGTRTAARGPGSKGTS